MLGLRKTDQLLLGGLICCETAFIQQTWGCHGLRLHGLKARERDVVSFDSPKNNPCIFSFKFSVPLYFFADL